MSVSAIDARVTRQGSSPRVIELSLASPYPYLDTYLRSTTGGKGDGPPISRLSFYLWVCFLPR